MGEIQKLKERVIEEQAKPLDQQNFAELKKQLLEIANNKQTPRAARNAQNLLKNVERYELVGEIQRAMKTQDEQFGKTEKGIESAKATKLAGLEDNGMFAVIGQFKGSTVFAESPGSRYYRIADDQGKTVCYARPESAALEMDLSKFIDKKVGLVGTIESSSDLSAAVVKFTNIVEFK
jgi:hypothetical protein